MAPWLSLSALALAVSVAGPARAQTDSERALARAAAEAGDKAFREGRYEDAVDYFSRAESILHAPTLLLHLARSYAKLGRYVLSREAYLKIDREVLGPDAPAAFRAAQDSARRELPEVEKKIARLTIRVDGPPRDTVRVSIDGQPIPNAVIGVPNPSDPGSHAVEVSSEGYDSKKLDVTLKEGGAGELAVTLTPKLPTADAAAADPGDLVAPAPVQPGVADDASISPARRSALRAGAYVGLGVGLAGAGLGTLFLVQRGNALSEADSRFAACSGGGRSCSDPGAAGRIEDLDDEAASRGTLAIVSYAAGVAGVGAGITLWLMSRSGKADKAAAVRPYFSGAEAGVLGRF